MAQNELVYNAPPQQGPNVPGSVAQGDILVTTPPVAQQEPPAPSPAPPDSSDNIPSIDFSTFGEPASDSPSQGLVSQTRSFWHTANAVLDTSPIEQAITGLTKLIPQAELNHNQPFRSSIANGVMSGVNGLNQLLYSVTTPKQIGIILGAAEYKAFAAAVNLWYGGVGAKDLFSLNTDTPWTDRLTGATQLAFSAMGLKSLSRTALRESIQNGFNISGNLVNKVADKIEKSYASMAAYMEEMDNASAAEVAAHKNLASGVRLTMSRILSDAADEALVIKQNVDAMYQILFDKATTPVTSVKDLRATITNTMADHGVLDKAIPKSVFKWLPNPNVVERPLTADEEEAFYKVRSWVKSKSYGAEQIRANLLDDGFDSDQIDLIMHTESPDLVQKEASAQMVQNTKNELYDAAHRNAGSPLGLALGDAQVKTDKILERYFSKKAGGAEALAEAKAAYNQYKNGVGQGVMQDLLFAKEQNERNIEKRVVDVLAQPGGNEIRSVLAGMGIDVSPLKVITEQSEEFTSTSSAQSKAIESSAGKTLSAIDLSSSVIPGRGDLSGLTTGQTAEEGKVLGITGLAKKTNLEIRLAAVRDFTRNAQSAGIKNPGALISTTIGAIRLLAGITFGLFAFGSGVSRMGIASALKNPAVVNWIIQEAEVDPGARARVVRALQNQTTLDSLFRYAEKTQFNPAEFPYVPRNVNPVRTGLMPQAIQQSRKPQNPDRLSAPREVIRIAQ